MQQNTSRKKAKVLQGYRGVTMLELLMTVGVVLALALITFLTLRPRRCLSELQSVTVKAAAVLREAGSRAAAQESSTVWGVHFSNFATATPFFALLPGQYYVSPSSSIGYHSFPPSIRYVTSSLAAGASTTILFKQLTGFPSSSFSIAVETVNCERYGSSTITVRSNGSVVY